MTHISETIKELTEDTTPNSTTKKATGNYAMLYEAVLKKITVDKTNEKIIKLLCLYFTGSEKFEGLDLNGNALDLDKGIFLYGEVGTGKTTVMETFSELLQGPRRFVVTSTRDVSSKFSKEGSKGIEIFGKNSFRTKQMPNGAVYEYQKPIARCFDDFGLEDNSVKFYGNTCNVMAEIILDRYDHFRKYKMLTHATSNIFSGDQIEDIYGDRVRSRMREMFNFIELPGKDRRK